MASAFIFYTIVFLVLLVFPAGLILTTLFFLEHERRLWKRVGPFIGPVRQKFGQIGEGLAVLRNLPDPAGPATPAYFMDQPQTLTFEKPDADSPSIRRLHTRLWQTPYCLAPTCRRVWVGTASFDGGMELSQRLHLPTHRIDSAIDLERALIADELVLAGARGEGYVTVSPPAGGNNAAGDPFWPDGHAVILVMP